MLLFLANLPPELFSLFVELLEFLKLFTYWRVSTHMILSDRLSHLYIWLDWRRPKRSPFFFKLVKSRTSRTQFIPPGRFYAKPLLIQIYLNFMILHRFFSFFKILINFLKHTIDLIEKCLILYLSSSVFVSTSHFGFKLLFCFMNFSFGANYLLPFEHAVVAFWCFTWRRVMVIFVCFQDACDKVTVLAERL